MKTHAFFLSYAVRDFATYCIRVLATGAVAAGALMAYALVVVFWFTADVARAAWEVCHNGKTAEQLIGE